MIFGDVNPSGVLPVTIPRHAGQLPVYYNYPKSKRFWLENGFAHPYMDMDSAPLYAFGHGLSYTTFEYSNLRMDKSMGVGGTARISVDIKNTGDRAGKHVVQLYIEDLVGSVETPVQELKGFRKILLGPGETQTVTLELGPDELALYDRHMEHVVEPGDFRIMIGAASDDIRLSDILTVY